jgi:hydroxypyruvate reductase 2
MADADPQLYDDEKPIVLIHRLPSIESSSFSYLSTHFHCIDPLGQPISDQIRRSVRALVAVGPTPVPCETLNLYPGLELVVGSSVGVDRIDLLECRRRGIAVTNAGESFSDDVADYSVGLLISVLRRVSAGDRYVRAGLWPKFGEYPLGFKLRGKRVGIVGLGNIGSSVAKRLVPFGCNIAYNSRSKKPSVPYTFYEKILDLALNSDILVVCCALTEETHHMINKDVLTALGKEGVLINVGRGGLVDEKELVWFLVSGELGGAGLDVFEHEPNVPKELLAMDNVVLSPHNAVLTPESLGTLFGLVLENLKAFFSNKPLISPVMYV